MINTNQLFSKKRLLKTAHITINVRKCIGCWECLSACSHDVLGKVSFLAHRHVRLVNPDKCKGCMACQTVCPQGAIF